MIKLVELNYHCHTEYSTPEEVIAKHALSSGFIHFIKQRVNLLLVKHLNYEGAATVDDIRYRFFKSRNKSWYVPFKTHRFIKSEKPDVILVQGFVFVLQVMFLRKAVGKDVIILVQHHGEKPFKGIKGFLQRRADASINGYLFTSLHNATAWLDKKVIGNTTKCFEVLSASANFTRKDKNACKQYLGIPGNHNFLWVARLNVNKDPLTVVSAFEKYLLINGESKLYMIFQTEELLARLQLKISQSTVLQKGLQLVGKVAHEKLPDWYTACEFFISGSHAEGSGYALVEAMVCGCIPVVTAIPSFKKITAAGEYGLLFEPGNTEALLEKLVATGNLDVEKFSAAIQIYSSEHLSYKAVADQIYNCAVSLTAK
jgi:glycosyltransferase involved in cell wall biosynthesis